jgi:hypothetical protein
MVNFMEQNDGWNNNNNKNNKNKDDLIEYYTKLCKSNIFPELEIITKNSKVNIDNIINKSVDLHIELSKLKKDGVEKIIKEHKIKKTDARIDKLGKKGGADNNPDNACPICAENDNQKNHRLIKCWQCNNKICAACWYKTILRSPVPTEDVNPCQTGTCPYCRACVKGTIEETDDEIHLYVDEIHEPTDDITEYLHPIPGLYSLIGNIREHDPSITIDVNDTIANVFSTLTSGNISRLNTFLGQYNQRNARDSAAREATLRTAIDRIRENSYSIDSVHNIGCAMSFVIVLLVIHTTALSHQIIMEPMPEHILVGQVIPHPNPSNDTNTLVIAICYLIEALILLTPLVLVGSVIGKSLVTDARNGISRISRLGRGGKKTKKRKMSKSKRGYTKRKGKSRKNKTRRQRRKV